MADARALRQAASTLRPMVGDPADGQALWRNLLADLLDAEADRMDPRKAERIAAIAGDLWNELENLRQHWENTPRATFIQTYIDRYESEAI